MYFIRKVWHHLARNRSPQVVDIVCARHDFPYLVSFPRTGSHWLRILLEHYTQRPLLGRSFEYPPGDNYLLYHDHDLDLTLLRENVIYLHRDPVSVVYSQLSYHDQDTDDQNAIQFWAHRYACHLIKWLHTEECSKRKTIISYEDMAENLSIPFRSTCQHLGVRFDHAAFIRTSQLVTPAYVKTKTAHDEKAVNPSSAYTSDRTLFIEQHADFIHDIVQNAFSNFDLPCPYPRKITSDTSPR